MKYFSCKECGESDTILYVKEDRLICAECLTEQMGTDPLVTVCSECLRASCWLGHLMCELAHHAGTVERHASELRKLGYESDIYWELDPLDGAHKSDAPQSAR